MICGLCIKRIKISLFQVSWSDFVIFLFMKAASFNSIDSIPGYLHKDMQVIHTHTHTCAQWYQPTLLTIKAEWRHVGFLNTLDTHLNFLYPLRAILHSTILIQWWPEVGTDGFLLPVQISDDSIQSG